MLGGWSSDGQWRSGSAATGGGGSSGSAAPVAKPPLPEQGPSSEQSLRAAQPKGKNKPKPGPAKRTGQNRGPAQDARERQRFRDEHDKNVRLVEQVRQLQDALQQAEGCTWSLEISSSLLEKQNAKLTDQWS